MQPTRTRESPRNALERKQRPADAQHDTDIADDAAREREREGVVRCAACSHGLARTRDELSVDGSSRHTFVNPAMQVFKLVCYERAEGAACVGEVSDYWSWFEGYHWQIALCRRCAAHVGWRYLGGAGTFFGLIESAITLDP